MCILTYMGMYQAQQAQEMLWQTEEVVVVEEDVVVEQVVQELHLWQFLPQILQEMIHYKVLIFTKLKPKIK